MDVTVIVVYKLISSVQKLHPRNVFFTLISTTVDWTKILSFNFSSTAANLSQITYKYVL